MLGSTRNANPISDFVPLLQEADKGASDGYVALDALGVGARLEVETAHHTYLLENHGNGEVTISGHPEYCPEPVVVECYGAAAGAPLIKVSFIGRGMLMVFRHPRLGVIRTSSIREIHKLPAPVRAHAN
jgi:hypothetical protein